jgi:hypothetical protein
MTWFAFAGIGRVYDLRGVAEKELASTGAHGYATEQQALEKPNSEPNPEQSALLAEFDADAQLPAGGGALGVIAVENVTAPKGSKPAKTPQEAQKEIAGQTQTKGLDPLAGIAGSLTGFYHALTDGKMWRSLGWIILGIVLMLTGVLLWIGPSAERMSPLGVLGNAARRAYG